MSDHFSWKETSPKRWEQRLGFMDRFYKVVSVPPGQQAHWIATSAIRFRYSGPDADVVQLIRNAWVEMRHQFPTLAARMADDKPWKICDIPDNEATQLWLDQTFRIHPDQTAADVFRHVVKEKFTTLHFCPSSSELILQAEHFNMDGRGLLFFWNIMFSALSSPRPGVSFDNVGKAMPPTLDDLLKLPEIPTDESRGIAMEMASRLANDSPICLPEVDISRPPEGQLRREIRLSPELTRAIIGNCKAKGFTVTSAWHAALILATRHIQASVSSPGTTCSTFTNFDLRRFSQVPFDGPALPVGCYHAGSVVRITPGDRSFADIATELNAFYKYSFSDTSGELAALPALVDILSAILKDGPVQSSVPVLSSIGVIDDLLRSKFGNDWEVVDVWVGDTTLTAEIISNLWTWQGQLVLSGCYNEAYYSEETVKSFLTNIANTLMEGLEVSLPM